jgi:GntR family transcriptional regulator
MSGAPLARGAGTPLHVQCRSRLHRLIEAGELTPGTRLPPERALAAAWGVSLAPVRQAILDLVADGYLSRVRGSGTYVRAGRLEKKLSILSSFTETLRATAAEADVRLLHCGRVPAPAAVLEALGARGRTLLRIERVGLLDGEPVAHVVAYLAPGAAPGLKRRELEHGSLYELLDRAYDLRPCRADSLIEVTRVSEGEAALLGLERGAPALAVEGTTFDQHDRPIEFTRVLYRADRFRFSLESHRRPGGIFHIINAPRAPHSRRGQ